MARYDYILYEKCANHNKPGNSEAGSLDQVPDTPDRVELVPGSRRPTQDIEIPAFHDEPINSWVRCGVPPGSAAERRFTHGTRHPPSRLELIVRASPEGCDVTWH
jgi:hypothetical protein